MDRSFYIEYNGKILGDASVAKLVYDNVKGCNCMNYKEPINWLLEHCTQLNTINVANAIQHLYYYLVGISNSTLWNNIDNYCEELAEEGKIVEW